MNIDRKIGNGPSLKVPQDEDDKRSGPQIRHLTPEEISADQIGLEKLEESLALQLEKEFSEGEVQADNPVEAEQKMPDIADTAPAEISARLLEIQRKRTTSAEMEERIRDGANLLASLSKQAGVLTAYLEKTEFDLKKLEKVEANATKLRVASEGICRKNHELKSTVEEQKKRITLLETKIGAMREFNETARTNLARLLEEKRIATVDQAASQSEIARLESDRRSMAERIEAASTERSELIFNLEQVRERERATALELRKKDDELSRKIEEIEELRDLKKHNAIEMEELRSRNSALESKAVEQKSRVDELTFELDSGRKEFEEIIRLKQQRIVELESRSEEIANGRHEISEEMTPSVVFEPDNKPQKQAKQVKQPVAAKKTVKA